DTPGPYEARRVGLGAGRGSRVDPRVYPGPAGDSTEREATDAERARPDRAAGGRVRRGRLVHGLVQAERDPRPGRDGRDQDGREHGEGGGRLRPVAAQGGGGGRGAGGEGGARREGR